MTSSLVDIRMSKAGFTLIELLLVVVIVVILAGIAIPVSAGFINERQLYNAATQVQQDLLLAQNLAITHSTTDKFKVTFSPSTNSYTVVTSEDSTKIITRKFSSSLSFTVSFPGGGNVINFDNQGIPHPGGGVINISNTSSTKVVTVTISTIGRVKIDWVTK